MRIAIFEHVCGGGMLHEPLPLGLVSQGSAMLQAVALGFARAGHEVVTLLEGRVCVPLPHVQVRAVPPRADVTEIVDELCDGADQVLIIAPESGGELVRWLTRLAQQGCPTLCSTPEAASLCADKLLMAQHLARHGIATPATYEAEAPLPEGLAGPLIVKPRSGAGCEHTHVCDASEVAEIAAAAGSAVVQPRIPGATASATLIAYPDGTLRPLRAGLQFITGKRELRYNGGRIPLEPNLEARALELATRAAATVPGLRGFIGVDLVLGYDAPDDHVIEINARCTLSLAILAQLTAGQAVAAILDPDATITWPDGIAEFDETGALLSRDPDE